MEKNYYTFEFSVKSSITIRYFSSCAKKKLNFVDQCYCWNVVASIARIISGGFDFAGYFDCEVAVPVSVYAREGK